MDVYCRHCGEPSDVYHVEHDMELRFRKMFKAGKGCDCCEGKGSPANNGTTERADIIAELLGDDLDGQAAMLDDMGFMFDDC